ncbi:MAG: hypothetical protein J5606_07685 [Bacteroidales bacterium]|nr:hypothetical protein [Bacteroidales bacterium]
MNNNSIAGVVVKRENGDFNFGNMTISEMCDLLEKLIEEINRRKENKTDVGFWDKNGNYKKDVQPVENPVDDYGITINGGFEQTNLVDIKIPQDAENVCFTINNFEINIPDLECTQNIMQHYALQHSIPYNDAKTSILDNLTELLQCIYGVQIGFQNEDIKRVEVE